MPIGLIASIFTTICLFLVSIFNNKTKKIFSSYWFYSITSLIFFIYFIVFRWVDDLKSWINQDSGNLIGGLDVIKSKVLLLDLCPFNAFVLPLFLIFDKKRNVASCISFLGIVGGMITIYGQIMFEGIGTNNPSWVNIVSVNSWWEYIFFNDLYFLMHFYILVISYIVLLNSHCFNLKKIIFSHVYSIIFFTYITIISFTLDIKWNVTGIVENDWSDFGEYAVVGDLLSFLVWPFQPIVGFTFIWLVILLMMFLRNLMLLDKKYLTRDIFISRNVKNSYISFLYKVYVL